MEINLKPEHERLLQEQLQSGRYRGPSEVVEKALELLRQRDDLDRDDLRAAIRKGFDQVEAGEFVRIDSEADIEILTEQIHQRGLQRLASEPPR